MVYIKLGNTVLAQISVSASILAANSTNRSLLGEFMVTCVGLSSGVASLVCDGDMAFGTAAGVTEPTCSTADYLGGPNMVQNVSTATPLLLDVTEKWSNAQAGQGTTITQAILLAA